MLGAMMSMSASNASASAKASSIYSNIRSIKTAATLWQARAGEYVHENDVSEEELKDFIDLDIYRDFCNGTDDANDNVRYAIVAGTLEEETTVLATGAYVICQFSNDGDRDSIAGALEKYKDVRLDGTGYTIGTFLFHVTPRSAEDSSGYYPYNTAFTFPSASRSAPSN